MARAELVSTDIPAGLVARSSVPAVLVAALPVLGLSAAQGGYFPTSWGWSSALLLWATALWCIVSGRTEMQRPDVVFVGLLLALACWVGASIAWSDVVAQSVLEAQRALVPVAGVAAFLVVARRRDLRLLSGALLAFMTLAASYALATRLFPDRLGSYDPIAAYRLSDPVGYWNGLGIYCAMAIVLAAGGLVHAGRAGTRALAGAAVPMLATTLYFTYSRGAWLALAVGVVVLVAASRRRLQLVTVLVLVTLPTVAAVWLASREHALTHRELQLDRAVDEGRRLALVVVAAAIAAAVLALVWEQVARRVTVGRRVRRGYAGVLVVAAAICVVALGVRFGGPVSMADRAWTAFASAPPRQSANLNDRLFNLSGNGRAELWRAARTLYSEHPVLGSGAGTFERYWQSRPDAEFKVRDAHGLYVETLAELGPVGLVLLLAVLALPVVAGVLSGAASTTPAALGAYIAFCVHAGVDWDWELAGVTLTALLIGSLLVIAVRREPRVVTIGGTSRVAIGAAAIVASVAALGALLGNSALAQARDAVDDSDQSVALRQADRAQALMPWSPWPWIVHGEAQLHRGDLVGAAADFRRATEIDAGEWQAWHYLGVATTGTERRRAIHRAAALYPRKAAAASAP